MSIRRVSRSLIQIVVLGFILPSPAFANLSVISAGSATAGPGYLFTVPVTVSGVSDLYAFQFDLGFNSQIIQLLAIDEGPFLSSAGITFFGPGVIDNTAGTASFTFDSLTGPVPGASGSGTIASFTFQSISQGVSPLALSNIVLLDSASSDIAFASADGSATIVPEPAVPLWLAAGLALFALGAGKLLRPAAR